MPENINEDEVRQAGTALLKWCQSQGLSVDDAFSVTFEVAMYLSTCVSKNMSKKQKHAFLEYMVSECWRAHSTKMM